MRLESKLLRRALSTMRSLFVAAVFAGVASNSVAADPPYFSKYDSIHKHVDQFQHFEGESHVCNYTSGHTVD